MPALQRIGPRELGDRVVVLSPHFDDAVFSIGGMIAAASDAGAAVSIVTVFAGDPDSDREASSWDRLTGFRRAGEAARARRAEDGAACMIVGATPQWLRFDHDEYACGDAQDDMIAAAIAAATENATTVLVPGFPLRHPDHQRVARLVRSSSMNTVRGYVEQPYAAAMSLVSRPSGAGGDHEWCVVPSTWHYRRRKAAAMRSYRSQLRALGRLTLLRIAAYELVHGGESVTGVR